MIKFLTLPAYFLKNQPYRSQDNILSLQNWQVRKKDRKQSKKI